MQGATVMSVVTARKKSLVSVNAPEGSSSFNPGKPVFKGLRLIVAPYQLMHLVFGET
jgi:hypothetical protein